MSEKAKRKSTRLREFDYSENGAYFLTVCTEKRKNLLSKIVGEGFSLPKLTQSGEIVDKWIKQIPQKYSGISVDEYVIMPNHIHLLLSINNDGGRGYPSPTITAVMGWFKYNATAEINRKNGAVGVKIFQRSFYDHIVRGEEDYKQLQKYICENPLKWKLDKLYKED